jgi:adenosine deaminase
MDLRQLPKVELHLHLDCSLSYKVVSQIDPSITLEGYRADFIAPAKCLDLADYLLRTPSSYPLMQTEEQLRLVTLDLFEQLYRDNVLYAEIRFAPLLHIEGGLSARQVVATVEAATAQAVRSTGIEARIILCTLRYYSTAQSLETVRLVEDFRGTYVAGFDIAADKPGDAIQDHVPAFQYARDRGIPCTAHVGETRGIENVSGRHIGGREHRYTFYLEHHVDSGIRKATPYVWLAGRRLFPLQSECIASGLPAGRGARQAPGTLG